MPWNFAAELRGRPLREIIHAGISIQFDCDRCGHRAVWPWPTMMREEKLQTLMGKMIHKFAPKLRCVSCGEQNFYMRPYMPRDEIKPTH
jgi:ribosomal protein L37E